MKTKIIFFLYIFFINTFWWMYFTFKPIDIYDRILTNLGDSNYSDITYTKWKPSESYIFSGLQTSNRVGILNYEFFLISFMQEYVPDEVDSDIRVQLIRDKVTFNTKYYKSILYIIITNILSIILFCLIVYIKKYWSKKVPTAPQISK